MRLLGIVGVTGWAIASTASAMSLEAQHAAVRAAAFSRTSITPVPIGAVPFANAKSGAGPSLSWLSMGASVGVRPDDVMVLSTIAEKATAGAVLAPQDANDLQPTAYDLSYRRNWPSAFSLAVGGYDIDLSPHAGLGAGASGRTAEAGAMVRFGKNLGDKVADRLGVRDSATFGGQARWYLFAASSGTAVGLNLMHTEGDWRQMGVSEDAASALIGDTQAGFGWRKGPMAAALGYVHREVKIRQGLEGLMGAGDRKDDRVALSFTIKQH